MYNPTVMAYSQRRGTIGPLAGATHQGTAGVPGDGSYLILWLQVARGRILKAAYSTIGCPAAQACGSWAAAWLPGKPLAAARALTAGRIVEALGGLPDGKEYCPHMVIEAIKNTFSEGIPHARRPPTTTIPTGMSPASTGLKATPAPTPTSTASK